MLTWATQVHADTLGRVVGVPAVRCLLSVDPEAAPVHQTGLCHLYGLAPPYPLQGGSPVLPGLVFRLLTQGFLITSTV